MVNGISKSKRRQLTKIVTLKSGVPRATAKQRSKVLGIRPKERAFVKKARARGKSFVKATDFSPKELSILKLKRR